MVRSVALGMRRFVPARAGRGFGNRVEDQCNFSSVIRADLPIMYSRGQPQDPGIYTQHRWNNGQRWRTDKEERENHINYRNHENHENY